MGDSGVRPDELTNDAAEAAEPRARRAAAASRGTDAAAGSLPPHASTRPDAPPRVTAGSDAPSGRRRRQPRFALPDDHHDPRVVEAISSLLDVPVAAGPEPGAPAPTPALATAPLADPRRGSPRGPLPHLDTRADWHVALRHEAARHDRYSRPVAVAAVEVVPVTRDGPPPPRVLLDALLGHVGGLLRANSRVVDRIARVGLLRFNVLLPETGWDEARAYAERVSAVATREVVRGATGVRLRIAIGVPGTGESLEETLALTEAALVR